MNANIYDWKNNMQLPLVWKIFGSKLTPFPVLTSANYLLEVIYDLKESNEKAAVLTICHFINKSFHIQYVYINRKLPSFESFDFGGFITLYINYIFALKKIIIFMNISRPTRFYICLWK